MRGSRQQHDIGARRTSLPLSAAVSIERRRAVGRGKQSEAEASIWQESSLQPPRRDGQSWIGSGVTSLALRPPRSTSSGLGLSRAPDIALRAQSCAALRASGDASREEWP